jgi:hypothetical protein
MTFLWKEDKDNGHDDWAETGDVIRPQSPFSVVAIGEYDGATDELTLHNPPNDDDGVDA